jgi:hypothetical protein
MGQRLVRGSIVRKGQKGTAMDIQASDREMELAHASIGGFIVRCSLLEYRMSQFIARWFCEGEKQKFLSYTLQAMKFREKRQVIEVRLSTYHGAPDDLKAAIAEIAPVLERRDLVGSGVLSRLRSTGELCIKSFAGTRFLSGEGEIDIIAIDDLVAWSERASELSERLIKLGSGLSQIRH